MIFSLNSRTWKNKDPISQFNWPPKDPSRPKRYKNYKFKLPDQAFTYSEKGSSESFNPNLKPSNSYQRNSDLRRRITNQPNQGRLHVDRVSPYHPDYREDEELDQDDEEETRGVDVGCIPPIGSQRGLLTNDHQIKEEGEEEENVVEKKEFFPTLWKDEDEDDNRSLTSDSEEEDDDDDDDDLPLARNGQVRVRRGSEGYEVKSRSFNIEYQLEERNFNNHSYPHNQEEEEDEEDEEDEEEREREYDLKDQKRLQKLGFGGSEFLDEEEKKSRDLIKEEQSWRRSELERERWELSHGLVGNQNTTKVFLPSELMRRREEEEGEGRKANSLRPPLLENSRRPSATSSVNTSGDWGDE